MKSIEKLNEKHKLFADEYLSNGMNATQAYRSVYQGVADSTATTNGSALLRNTHIKEYIDIKRKEMVENLDLKKEEILLNLIHIMNTNLNDKPSVAIKAMETINKMQGYNAVEKSEVKLQADVVWNETKTYGTE